MPSVRSVGKAVAGALAALLVVSCLEPTQVRVVIETDAVCSDLDEVQITVGPPENLEEGLVAASTRECDEGRVGDLVFSPGDSSTHTLNFQVVVGVGKPTSSCAASNFLGGCIVARRALSYVPHRALSLPIRLELDCIDVPCSATQTCRSGSCVSSEVVDPSQCAEPGGCDGVASGGSSSGGASMGGASGGTASGGSETGGNDGSGGLSGTGGEPPIVRNPSSIHSIAVTTELDVADGDVASIDALVANPGTDGLVSLREALLAANSSINDAAPDRITFAIPNGGVPSIVVEAPGLPSVTDAVVLDASTQSSGRVELDGENAGSTYGLVLGDGSDGSEVRSLVVNRFEKFGIALRDSGSHKIISCLVGTDSGATIALPNGNGLLLENSANNVVGAPLLGTDPPNIFSGNVARGVVFVGKGTTGNTFIGNVVGLAGNAADRLGNEIGVFVGNGAHDNVIGGSGPSDRNIVSGNSGDGIVVTGSETKNISFVGNFVGSDSAFSADDTLGNGGAGFRVAGGARAIVLGSEDISLQNRIAYNAGPGVAIEIDAENTAILGNFLTRNGSLGIDLGEDGVTANRPTAGSTAPSDFPNFPVVDSTSYSGSEVTVNFTIDATPGTYRIEFFSVGTATASGHGEGLFREGVLVVNHPVSGVSSHSLTFPVGSTELLTATQTQVFSGGRYGTTSEFSLNVPTTYSRP